MAIAALGVGAYLVGWQTSAFSIRHVEVVGASGDAAERVRAALRPVERSRLVSFDSAEGRRLLAPLPFVASARFDRQFPNTLLVEVTPEQPIALLRRGRDTWVVAASGRVLRRVRTEPLPGLPRIWLSPATEPIVGAVVPDAPSADAVRALGPMRKVRLPEGIRSIAVVRGEVSLVLDSGRRVLLGGPTELRLKLTVVARVLPLVGDARVIDASVPDRVVAGSALYANSQVER